MEKKENQNLDQTTQKKIPLGKARQFEENWRRLLEKGKVDKALKFKKPGSPPQKVSSFLLDGMDLQELLSDSTQVLRISMSATVDDPANLNEVEEVPVFTPIIYGIFKEVNENFDNCFEMTLVPPIPSAGMRVPSEVARRFISDWSNFSDDLNEAFINEKDEFLKYYTFEKPDTDDIKAHHEKHNPNTQLYLHMGLEPDPGKDFKFRTVLEIRSNSSPATSSANGGGSLFFELSSPCPPSCDEGGDDGEG